ncbi:MAG: hypothetical protein BGO12_06445 [Verrucomicrobia bacterium 61-8]|nr:hypothetical protein [Verrucomicrobiota bacterium]OJV05427.1 MAG: hypothetical protein BGO12_06445 [Verrucomicrobia bacterium 61-8]
MKRTLPQRRKIDSQPSWVLSNDCVSLAVTELGGHMAPVTFCRDGARPVQPYYISPWQGERPIPMPATMAPLRGDFFCLPFGANSEAWRGENHPPHGETAGNRWELEDAVRVEDTTSLRLRLETKVRPGVVHREFTLRDGHNAVYCRTVIEGFRGRTPFAHHAVLAMPRQERALRIFTSPFTLGRTYPLALADPSQGEYQFLARDTVFRSLARVSSIFKGEPPADYSAFPARPGFCDLLQQFERPGKGGLSWVAAINTEENWMWFAIKNPAVMPGRLFWVENKGRHQPPWSGRNCCLGIEDGCMYFDRGVAESSRPNPISRRGIPTSVNLSGKVPFEVRYIQGAINVPKGFGDVAKAAFLPGEAVFSSSTGTAVRFALDSDFLALP